MISVLSLSRLSLESLPTFLVIKLLASAFFSSFFFLPLLLGAVALFVHLVSLARGKERFRIVRHGNNEIVRLLRFQSCISSQNLRH
jgi:hypothetical protein